METVIQIRRNSDYRAFLEWPKDGRSSMTHIGRVAINDKTAAPCYIKVHPENCRGLINEVTGYLLAHHAGLPVPSFAALLELSGANLRHACPNLPKGIDRTVAWCTIGVSGNSPKFKYGNTASRSSAFIRDINGWKQLPGAAALDEWIANVDRNTGNLIRTAPKTYCLIDHDQIATGIRWLWSHLNHSGSYLNKMAQWAWPKGPTLPAKSGMKFAAESFPSAWAKSRKELQHWCSLLLDDVDSRHLDNFLAQRADTIHEDIRNRYQLVV